MKIAILLTLLFLMGAFFVGLWWVVVFFVSHNHTPDKPTTVDHGYPKMGYQEE